MEEHGENSLASTPGLRLARLGCPIQTCHCKKPKALLTLLWMRIRWGKGEVLRLPLPKIFRNGGSSQRRDLAWRLPIRSIKRRQSPQGALCILGGKMLRRWRCLPQSKRERCH